MTVKANYDNIYLFSLTNVMPIRIAKCTFFILIARRIEGCLQFKNFHCVSDIMHFITIN